MTDDNRDWRDEAWHRYDDWEYNANGEAPENDPGHGEPLFHERMDGLVTQGIALAGAVMLSLAWFNMAPSAIGLAPLVVVLYFLGLNQIPRIRDWWEEKRDRKIMEAQLAEIRKTE